MRLLGKTCVTLSAYDVETRVLYDKIAHSKQAPWNPRQCGK